MNLKIHLKRFSNRHEQAKERIYRHEDWSFEIIKSEDKKRMKQRKTKGLMEHYQVDQYTYRGNP